MRWPTVAVTALLPLDAYVFLVWRPAIAGVLLVLAWNVVLAPVMVSLAAHPGGPRAGLLVGSNVLVHAVIAAPFAALHATPDNAGPAMVLLIAWLGLAAGSGALGATLVTWWRPAEPDTMGGNLLHRISMIAGAAGALATGLFLPVGLTFVGMLAAAAFVVVAAVGPKTLRRTA